MDELKILAQALSQQIFSEFEEIDEMDIVRGTNEYSRKLGEISAYNEVLGVLLYRMEKLEGRR